MDWNYCSVESFVLWQLHQQSSVVEHKTDSFMIQLRGQCCGEKKPEKQRSENMPSPLSASQFVAQVAWWPRSTSTVGIQVDTQATRPSADGRVTQNRAARDWTRCRAALGAKKTRNRAAPYQLWSKSLRIILIGAPLLAGGIAIVRYSVGYVRMSC